MYNLIVIGGGPAGYTAAIRAAQEGLKTALIEKGDLGGTCLNRGCIPTKSLLHSSSAFSELKNSSDLGITAENISFDFNKAYQYKDNVVTKLRNGVMSLIKANKIDYINSFGEFIDKETVKTREGDIKGENIIIATGSVPSTIPVKGVEYALNSDDVLKAPLEGDTVAIIGGGVIGVEFATILSDSGKTVFLIEALDRLIPMMSADLSNAVTMSLKKKKVKVSTSSRLSEIVKEGGNLKVKYEDRTGAKEITVDNVIVCTGRRHETSGLNLEKAGIETVRGAIKVNLNMYTGAGKIYAAGDVTGEIQLAHYAAAQGITAVESILSKPHSINLDLVPSCIYTNPEIASVGLSEENCKDKNIKTGKFMMGANGKSQINGINSGFAKVIIDTETDRIIGAELFMPNATDIIGELALAISTGVTVKDFLKVIHPHPTFVEAIYESAEDSEGKSIHLMPKK